MIAWLKPSGREKLARQQVDGIVCQSEEGADFSLEPTIPSTHKYRLHACEGGGASILFNSSKFITGGLYQSVKCGIQIKYLKFQSLWLPWLCIRSCNNP